MDSLNKWMKLKNLKKVLGFVITFYTSNVVKLSPNKDYWSVLKPGIIFIICSGREDDNIDTIKKKLQIFEESNYPVIQYYEDISKCRKLNTEKSINEIFEQTKQIMFPYAHPNIVFVTGEPEIINVCCGRLANEFNMKYISIGDLLKNKIEKGEVNDILIKEFEYECNLKQSER
jgi:adenylate kinase family enzyme